MIIVIGAGPAGISCATYLKRAGLDVSIITNNESTLLRAHKIDNYYGVGSITGKDLYEKGIKDATNLQINIIEDTIVNITKDKEFKLTGLKNNYNCSKVVLATGRSIKKVNIKGINDFIGKGISYCPTCDGYFFKDKTIGIIGSGKYLEHEYNYLKNITPDIFVFTNGIEDKLESAITNKIKEVTGNNKLEKIILDDNTEYTVDGLFIVGDYADTNILTKKVGIITDNNNIVVDNNLQTNIEGIYACGDNTDGKKQIAKAVYDGMMVANSIMHNN